MAADAKPAYADTLSSETGIDSFGGLFVWAAVEGLTS